MNKKILRIDDELSYSDYKKIEWQWRKNIIRFSDKELLSIFPEIIPDLSIILSEQEQEIQSLTSAVKTKLKSISPNADDFTIWLIKLGLQNYEIAQIAKLKQNISRIKRLIDLATGKKIRQGFLTDEDFNNAKNKPIMEVVEPVVEKFKRVGKIFMCLCPFHNEKTPSFGIWPDSNTFYCFGCGAKGNVIEFVKLFYKLNFIEAVKWLKDH